MIATLLLTTVGLMVLFALTYLWARRINNYGIVDFVWAYSFTAVAWHYALAGHGWAARGLVIASLATIWSVRLGSHLYSRVMSHHPQEDSRYVQLREDWQANFAPKMFGFFQLQAVSVVILSAPLFFPARNAMPAFNAWELIGTTITVLALLGETLADGQLKAFVRHPHNKGKVCKVGLWRYSRHPNYFFEWCIWVGLGLFACGSAWGWIGLIAPAAILHLLLNVTGVPMAEASSLKSKGDAFRQYQQETNAFFPGPTRSSE
ncbi:DUF1295 domain-containing protein [Actomonas aquatica]|uniref:DUF1295 domain-containing protein n=1 Tax=Actomonas aquatica TaxID=2866162 RepID=A0ABZ1CGV3_9BACT|nr:DUF1295 domain-containing protein [Opitutus sp. WL0086]WRQ89814.1 DUF1295 domain-containing protein [Opitutus sp. WL0086]